MRPSKGLVVFLLTCSFLAAAQDTSNTVRLADRSDWWSLLNENFYWPVEKPAGDDLSADNFEIAGIRLEHDPTFRTVKDKFGHAVSVSRGSNTTERQQICFASEHKPLVRLIFEQGDLNLSFYLIDGGQGWNGEALCSQSPQVSATLSTKGGLTLGMSQAEIIKMLGKPDVSSENRVVYQREVEKRTPDDKLADLRKEHAEMTEKDFHDSYDTYELDFYIEARFTDGKLTYLAVSKGEND